MLGSLSRYEFVKEYAPLNFSFSSFMIEVHLSRQAKGHIYPAVNFTL